MWEPPPSGRGRPPGVLGDSRKTEGGPASCSTGGRRAPRSDSQAGARPISAKGGREAQDSTRRVRDARPQRQRTFVT